MLAAALICSVAFAGSKAKDLSGDLVIFHAGSLSVPLKEIADAFMKEHPGVKVIREAAGSRNCARKISDLNRPCDVMASADYTVIDALLIPDHASWNIKFAANEMAIVYHDESRLAEKINNDNWTEILSNDAVRFGRSDPNADPCGYRAVLTMKLAENYYKKPGLADKMLAKDNKYIRPKETDLLALLESNTIDYIFLYRSVAEQHGLKFILLPDEVNLKRESLTPLYETVSVDISGKAPGEKITKKGAPMIYGVTIPTNSPNPKVALAFLEFMLDKDKGMKIMEKNGQPSVVPSFTTTFKKLPRSLKKFASSH
ncbi:MAG: tungstate ABC transporter substrate-binding protein WtpA [Candidatus Coatesbacteria bacterium]|nr:tungstate ABC transporter substrate-binding protein WtpA [Candidatus Coatesbacteria bacterium]